MFTKGQKFKNYTKEIKEEILRNYFEEYVPTTALSEEYGISKKTIQNWIYKSKQGKDVLVDHRQFSSGRPRKNGENIDYIDNIKINTTNIRLCMFNSVYQFLNHGIKSVQDFLILAPKFSKNVLTSLTFLSKFWAISACFTRTTGIDISLSLFKSFFK